MIRITWAGVMLVAILALAGCGALADSGSAPQFVPTPPALVAATSVPTVPAPTEPASAGLAPTAAPTSPSTAGSQPEPTQASQQQAAAPAPACTSPAPLTPSETEGPFYKAGSPERASLLQPGVAGTQLFITGYVLTADCKPVAHAWLDFWQANANGQYDNSGYTLRGHQYTDASGRYQLTTIVPGLYTGRTEHIHVKVQAPNGPVLTTQLYFPGVAQNESDGIFDPKMVMNVQNLGGSTSATFDFVVSTQ